MNMYVIGIENKEESSFLSYQPFPNAHDGAGEDFFIDYSYEEISELYQNAIKNAEENGVDPKSVVVYQLVPMGTKLCQCP